MTVKGKNTCIPQFYGLWVSFPYAFIRWSYLLPECVTYGTKRNILGVLMIWVQHYFSSAKQVLRSKCSPNLSLKNEKAGIFLVLFFFLQMLYVSVHFWAIWSWHHAAKRPATINKRGQSVVTETAYPWCYTVALHTNTHQSSLFHTDFDRCCSTLHISGHLRLLCCSEKVLLLRLFRDDEEIKVWPFW